MWLCDWVSIWVSLIELKIKMADECRNILRCKTWDSKLRNIFL